MTSPGLSPSRHGRRRRQFTLSSSSIIILATFLFFNCFDTIQAHLVDPRLRSFVIAQGTQGEVITETSALSGEKYVCVFSYAVRDKNDKVALPPSQPTPAIQVPQTQQVAPTLADPMVIVRQLAQKPCVKRTEAYWTYEICFGSGAIAQYHGHDIYRISTAFAPTPITQDNAISVTKGQTCEAKPSIQRSATIRLRCSKKATDPILFSLAETSVCVYLFDVATDLVCGDPRFPVIDDAVLSASQGRAQVSHGPPVDVLSAEDQAAEDWMLEVLQLDSGAIMCSALSTEQRATNSKLNFAKFDLQLRRGEQSQGHGPKECPAFSGAAATASVNAFTQSVGGSVITGNAVRKHGRINVDPEEVRVKPGRITSTSTFKGSLAFVKLTADTCTLR